MAGMWNSNTRIVGCGLWDMLSQHTPLHAHSMTSDTNGGDLEVTVKLVIQLTYTNPPHQCDGTCQANGCGGIRLVPN